VAKRRDGGAGRRERDPIGGDARLVLQQWAGLDDAAHVLEHAVLSLLLIVRNAERLGIAAAAAARPLALTLSPDLADQTKKRGFGHAPL
jgi:hypothetical protein